jgi:hypothetical protein
MIRNVFSHLGCSSLLVVWQSAECALDFIYIANTFLTLFLYLIIYD